MKVSLVSPSEKYQASLLVAIEEFKQAGASSLSWYYNLKDAFTEYIDELLQRPFKKTETIVPETVYWAIVDEEFVGRISVRHELNEYLAKFGGHIGYEVRPSFRGNGIGTEMLRLVLPEVKKLGLDRVLLTCDHTNEASIKIILANGGIYSGQVEVGAGKPKKNHYWIQL